MEGKTVVKLMEINTKGNDYGLKTRHQNSGRSLKYEGNSRVFGIFCTFPKFEVTLNNPKLHSQIDRQQIKSGDVPRLTCSEIKRRVFG